MKDMDEEMDKMDEQEDVEVTDDENIDVDIEKDVDIDDEETESDIRVKTSVPGESTEVEAVQGLLTKAQQQAEKLGDEKLMAQMQDPEVKAKLISNTEAAVERGVFDKKD